MYYIVTHFVYDDSCSGAGVHFFKPKSECREFIEETLKGSKVFKDTYLVPHPWATRFSGFDSPEVSCAVNLMKVPRL